MLAAILATQSELQRRSQVDLDLTKESLAAIRELKSSLPQESESNSALSDKVQRVRSGLATCGIPDSAISAIDSLVRTPVPKSVFAREDVTVRFRGLTLTKLLMFIENEEQREGGVVCTAVNIRQSPISKSIDEELWDADVLLTQVVANIDAKKRK